MKVTLVAIGFILILGACKQKQSQKQLAVSPERKGANARVSTNKPDSNYFDKPVAVLVYPSLRLIEKVKKTMPEDDFYIIADDGAFYQAEAGRYLDSLKVTVVNRKSEGVLRFKTESGRSFTIKLDTVFYKAILFNGISKPFNSNMVVIDQDYNTYMKVAPGLK